VLEKSNYNNEEVKRINKNYKRIQMEKIQVNFLFKKKIIEQEVTLKKRKRKKYYLRVLS